MAKVDVAFIIDDDQIYVYGMKKLMALHNLCKRLEIFNNGEEGIRHIERILTQKEELPDVILLDINMPVLDGWGFLDEFVKLKPKLAKKVTIYLLTSSIDPADVAKAESYAEISEYWIKPVKLDELLKAFS